MIRRFTFSCVLLSIALVALQSVSFAQGTLPTQTLDLSVEDPTNQPHLSVKTLAGGQYDGSEMCWSLNNNTPAGFQFIVRLPSVMSFAIIIDGRGVERYAPYAIEVNGTKIATYVETEPTYHPIIVRVPTTSAKLQAGNNTVTIKSVYSADPLAFPLNVKSVTLTSLALPRILAADSGSLSTDLYVQFALASITGAKDAKGNELNKIWTRAYGTSPSGWKLDDPSKTLWAPNLDQVPGPTLAIHPDDLVQVNLVNELNKVKSDWLKEFEANILNKATNNPDDIEGRVTHEINIPHNADNTNLHVHGLHVDPHRDDVTLLIIPENDKPSNYNTELQKLIPNAKIPSHPNADGKYWTWKYSYKIPSDHLTGTHWYHSHKHGSTSTQVENGMAGTIVIRPKDEGDSITPGLWNDDATKTHDRVMVLQEIANYGIQQGPGKGTVSDGNPVAIAPDITINGTHQPTLQLAQGQIERWRILNAGANHKTSSYFWLGKKAGEKYVDATDATMYVVAFDGITLKAPIPVTAAKPIVLGAGNRADVVVMIPNAGSYALFKSYPSSLTDIKPPADLAEDPFALGSAYFGFSKPWPKAVDEKGELLQTYKTNKDKSKTKLPLITPAQPMAPLLQGKLVTSPDNAASKTATVAFSKANEFPDGRWQPITVKIHKAGGIDQQLLMYVNVVSGTPNNGSTKLTNLANRMNANSPTGAASNLKYYDTRGQLKQGRAPGYVAPIKASQVSNHQVMVFDRSGIEFNYQIKGVTQNAIKQFSLNGRQFNLEDFVGNPGADGLIRRGVPRDAYFDDVDQKTKVDKRTKIGEYSYDGVKLWSNYVGASAYWANPGYYAPIVPKVSPDNIEYYTYDNKSTAKPTYATVTGISEPNQPENRSAEEWLLINNSSIFHPFHIHINPFFVTEVGQLNYDGSTWKNYFISLDPNRTADSRTEKKVSSELDYVLENWWDVIMIPPHGYVKFRMWINVPSQSADSSSVLENSNVPGAWVFHCHILRHEDRGMMMVVKTKAKGD